MKDLNQHTDATVSYYGGTLSHDAEAYLGMGELEQDLNSAQTAVPMTKALASARTELMRQFADQLEPYGNSVTIREFRGHLNSELAA